MADGGGPRCLSDLPDDLLRHILFFAPAKEGATTAILSRRWRWLWRTSGAVNLDSRSWKRRRSPNSSRKRSRSARVSISNSAMFLRGAKKALAAAESPIRRLTFFVEKDSEVNLMEKSSSDRSLIETLLSNPAVRCVEELRIEVKSRDTQCTLSLGSLPSEALRVLRIVKCSTLTAALPPGAVVFPMLADLHLEDCSVPLIDLQSIVDASPRLCTLHLASTHLSTGTNFTDNKLPVGRLLIPAVSSLVLVDCRCGPYPFISARLEMDVPRLQYFRYRGHIEDTNERLVQESGNMVHADLHLTHDPDAHAYDYIKGPTPPAHKLLWQFIQNFSTTKVLKLRIEHFTMDDLTLVASWDELLGGLSFSRLDQLELDVKYKPGQASMAMLADLLHCCPMVRDLRIKLTKQHEWPWSESSIGKENGVHFGKSVSGFRSRRRTSLAGQNDDNYEAFDIPSITSDHSFSCLQSHLKRVSLQFFMDKPNCLGVRLAKFFAKNAMVLQEMHTDDGKQEMLEHVNYSVPRWIAKTYNGNNQLNVKD